MRKRLYKAAFILCLALIAALAMSVTAFGADAATDDPAKNDPAKDAGKGIVYTLTYPDGTVKTTTDYEEAKKMESEMILLYEGKTDKDGKIVLPDWAREGEIKIVEKEVPAGYTAVSTETNAKLQDGGVTIVNYKDDVVKTQGTETPGGTDQPTVRTADTGGSDSSGKSSSSSSSSSGSSGSGGSSRTGDSGSPMIMLLLLAAAAMGGGVVFARRRMAR